MSLMKKLLLMSVSGLTAAALLGCSNSDADAWTQGESYGQWRLIYDGYGLVSGNDQEVVMYPTSAASYDMTHACLVVTNDVFEGDIDFEVTTHTEEFVRLGEANPWEVGWILWNYQDDEHFYALALKPNGWELSKQDPAYPGNQRFLTSGHEPKFPINNDYRARIVQTDNTITVFADGEKLGEFTDTETPYSHGAIGLYTEDAKVRFKDLDLERTTR